MKNQLFAYFSLTVQCLFKCADCKVARHATIRYTCNDAAVIEVENCAVIADIATCEKQVREVGQPFLIHRLGSKLLSEQICKMHMLCSRVIFGWFSLYDGAQPEFLVHVLMNGYGRKIDALPLQIDSHSAITVNTTMRMVEGLNLMENPLLFRLLLCPPMFSVVVISVRINVQPSQQPSNAKEFSIFVDESICL